MREGTRAAGARRRRREWERGESDAGADREGAARGGAPAGDWVAKQAASRAGSVPQCVASVQLVMRGLSRSSRPQRDAWVSDDSVTQQQEIKELARDPKNGFRLGG